MLRNFTPEIHRQGRGMGGDWPQPLHGARRGLVCAGVETSDEAVEAKKYVESKRLTRLLESSNSLRARDGVILGSTNGRSMSPIFWAKPKSTNLVSTTGTQIVLCITKSPKKTPNTIPKLSCEPILILTVNSPPSNESIEYTGGLAICSQSWRTMKCFNTGRVFPQYFGRVAV